MKNHTLEPFDYQSRPAGLVLAMIHLHLEVHDVKVPDHVLTPSLSDFLYIEHAHVQSRSDASLPGQCLSTCKLDVTVKSNPIQVSFTFDDTTVLAHT